MELKSRIDLSSFSNFVNKLQAATFNEILDADANAYLSGMRTRYLKQGQGAGEWPELRPRTRKDRIRQGFDPDRPILLRESTLFNALTPGNPGHMQERDGDRLRVGFGGNDPHPGYAHREPDGESHDQPRTIAEVAAIHQYGFGNVPPRMILVNPDPQTLGMMQADALTSFANLISFII